MQFIGNISEEGVKNAMEENEVIKKADEELEYLSGDEEVRRIAELREKKIRDDLTNLKGEREEGRKEGREEEKIEIARKMKLKNMPVDEIIEVIGLTKEEIEKL